MHTDTRAIGETSVWGTVSGDYHDTTASDDVWQSITEVLTPGVPQNRFSVLEHHWTFNISAGSRVEFHVEAFQTISTDWDDFDFEYSIDAGQNWERIPVGRLPYADEDYELAVEFPTPVSGTVLIRVIDTNHTPATQDLDTITVDELFVRSIGAP
jgi:hypothetical protein